MAAYGASAAAESTARSNAELEAEKFKKEFRRKNNICESAPKNKKNLFESGRGGKGSALENAFKSKQETCSNWGA